jgi:hypothetical protein
MKSRRATPLSVRHEQSDEVHSESGFDLGLRMWLLLIGRIHHGADREHREWNEGPDVIEAPSFSVSSVPSVVKYPD